jgi:hypothetical protein
MLSMKSLFAICFFTLSVFGSTSVTEVAFESGVSFYGKVGVTKLVLEEDLDKQTYKIKVTATSTGILKAISNNRIDTFLSEGIIKDGVYIPLSYTKKAVATGLDKVTTYKFNHTKNFVTKELIKKKSVTTTRFDHTTFRFVEDEKIVVTKNKKKLPIYKNDFLTLYLNLKHNNLKYGNIRYLDQKPEDSVSLINKNLFIINKDNGEQKIKVILIDDAKNIFFQKATSEVSFYGEAYIKKVSQKITFKGLHG